MPCASCASAGRSRVRGIESAHHARERVDPGARVALNLVGVDHHDVGRGDALVREHQWLDATGVDARVRSIPGAPERLPSRLRAAVGSGEHPVRVRVLDDRDGIARLRFDVPLPLAVGDRVVLRDPARARTIAGAEILDVESRCASAAAAAALTLAPLPRVLAGHGWSTRTELGRLLDRDAVEVDELVADAVAHGAVVAVGDWLAPPDDLRQLRQRAGDAVGEHHRAEPLSPGVEVGALAARLGRAPDQLRAALIGTDRLGIAQGVVFDPASRATRVRHGRRTLARRDSRRVAVLSTRTR